MCRTACSMTKRRCFRACRLRSARGTSHHEDETRLRMLAVTTFLETKDCHSRMLRCRDVMSISRGPVLARAGPEWEISQMKPGELRTYHACEAYFESDTKKAVARLCSGRGLPAVTTWGGLPSGPTFAMLVCGAASLIGFVSEEQEQYPYKLFACLANPDVVDEVLLDVAERSHMMVPMSKNHVRRYATKERMLSVEAIACLESAALVIPETTRSSGCFRAWRPIGQDRESKKR